MIKKKPYIISPDINVNILEILFILGVYCAIDAFGSLVSLWNFFFPLLWSCCTVYGISVPWPETEPGPWQWWQWKPSILTTSQPGNSPTNCYGNPNPSWQRISWHRVFQKGVRLLRARSKDNQGSPTSCCTRESRRFSWISSQFSIASRSRKFLLEGWWLVREL